MCIRAILFDKDDTLTDLAAFWKQPVQKTCKYIAESCGQSDNAELIMELELTAGFSHGHVIPESIVMTGTNKLAVNAWLKVLSRHGIHRKERFADDLSSYLRHASIKYGDVKENSDLKILLPTLRERGLILGIVTSDVYSATVHCMKTLGIAEHFDCIVASDHVRNPKPAPDAFKLFQQYFRVQPDETLMVGDSENDMLFAKNCGIKGILYRKKLPSKLPPGADLAISDLMNIMEFI